MPVTSRHFVLVVRWIRLSPDMLGWGTVNDGARAPQRTYPDLSGSLRRVVCSFQLPTFVAAATKPFRNVGIQADAQDIPKQTEGSFPPSILSIQCHEWILAREEWPAI